MKLEAYYNGRPLEAAVGDHDISVVIPCESENAFLEIRFLREQWDRDEYVLFPASAYNGNRFECLHRPYPPMFTTEEASVTMQVTVTGSVARLNLDGTGKIAVTSGDLSVPCVGILNRKDHLGMLLYTVQQVRDRNVGITYGDGAVSVWFPCRRNDAYPYKAREDVGMSFRKGERIVLAFRLFEFACGGLEEFFRAFAENRKCMGLPADYAQYTKENSPETLFGVIRDKFNALNYSEKRKAYLVGVVKDYAPDDPFLKFQVWQPGWVGGAISSYPLMRDGSEDDYKRGIATLDFLFSTQRQSGFFPGIVGEDGQSYGDAFGEANADDWHLVRKSADVLLFLYKQFDCIKEKGNPVPDRYREGAGRLADAFVRLWERYGQFGQFVSHENGDIVVGGSSSPAIAPAGLAKSYLFFGEERYLRTAEESGEYYYRLFLKDGCTTGGPGEILQCPDSESAFGLLESMVTLYEVTKDEKWIGYAKCTADYCSTWVVAYNYTFPKGSEFAGLGIRTVGSVFANAQNKHSAPGICTLSGDSLYRLYLAGGGERYLELIRDIAFNIFQYVSTEARPVRAKTKDGYRPMPPGYVNERVNMSDWEEGRVGEVFYGSTWAETSVMLTWSELREALQL